MLRRFPTSVLARACALALTGLGGCTGTIGEHGDGDWARDTPLAPLPSENDPVLGPPVTPTDLDPGRVAIHRLNNTEYDNTLRDLLGTSRRPSVELNFLAEEGFGTFDNTATALGMTASQYQKYFDSASTAMDEALGDPQQQQRFLTCTPVAASDACAQQIVERFGLRIYRRPLESDEVTRALKVYDADLARTGDGAGAIAQALRAMLSAASFLYRIERDEDPGSPEPHPLSGYEIASRLSYFLWSTTPDDGLLGSAERGELLDAAALEQTATLMLDDPRAAAFTESFAGQAFQFRKLLTHSVTPQVFPTFSLTLADAMLAEGLMWFDDFLHRDAPVTAWFTEDFNYVNDELARHYGIAEPGTGAQLVRVEADSDQRKGFLGLSGFLTLSSVPSRTSPTYRGAWLLSQLLCSPPAPPPAGVPPLDDSAEPDDGSASGSENVRERLERHRTDPTCAGCHRIIDPMGLGLERFDGIGRYRESYGNGDPILPDGVLADGTAFSGADELGVLIGDDPRFTQCMASKLFSYALGREVEDFDDATLQLLHEHWDERGLTLGGLTKEVILSDAFRLRRGELP